MVENYLDIVKDIKEQNKTSGDKINDDEIRNNIKTADKNIKWYTIRKLIIAKENISVDPTKINLEIDKLVENSPDSEKQIRKFYKPSNRKKIEDGIVENKILDYLKQFVKVKDVEVNTKKLRSEVKS